MTKRSIAAILAAVSVTAFATPVLAETSVCVVKTPELRLRKGPSKKAKVVAILKKDAQVTAETCSGGWVKVASQSGRLSGYVGGWALLSETPKAAAASSAPAPATAAQPAVAAPSVAAKPEAALPVTAALKEVPSNEKLAIQITELRLNVIGIERDMDKMNKDIQKIKAVLRHKGAAKKVAAHNKKTHKLMAKR